MKYTFGKQLIRFFLLISQISLLTGCATLKEQKSSEITEVAPAKEEPTHTFYIAGGLGNLKKDGREVVLDRLRDQLEKAHTNSTMIFTGDNIVPKKEQWEFDKKRLEQQIAITNKFKGQTILLPNAGFRTDDGLFLGVTNVFTNNGFNGNPFRQEHSFGANYYFKFEGVELTYQGIFANIFPKWNFEVDGYFTNDRFSNNYFGSGNETFNPDGQLDWDYNRARMRQVKLNVGIAYRTLKIKGLFESFKVGENPNRYFTPDNVNPNVFNSQEYVGGELSLS